MPIIKLPQARLIRLNNNAVTDHNRQPLALSVERIENKQRMADGTLRKYVVGDKRTFSVSWEGVPGLASKTVDGYWGANDLEAFYYAQFGSVTLELTMADATVQTYTCMFTTFTKELQHRGAMDWYNMTIELEEV